MVDGYNEIYIPPTQIRSWRIEPEGGGSPAARGSCLREVGCGGDSRALGFLVSERLMSSCFVIVSKSSGGGIN